MIIPPLVQSVTEKLPDGMQKFDHSQVHVTLGQLTLYLFSYTCARNVIMILSVYPCAHNMDTILSVYPCAHNVDMILSVYPC